MTDTIEYGDDNGIYHKPMFIMVEISNNSNKNFYQSPIGHGVYAMYTENPVELIEEDLLYTNFEIQPMYVLNDEVKTEQCGCVLKKLPTTESAKTDEKGNLYDINYFVLKPGEKTTAYMLCYFREDMEGAQFKTILLYNSSKQFMYFLD